jgi:hypothetical protein
MVWRSLSYTLGILIAAAGGLRLELAGSIQPKICRIDYRADGSFEYEYQDYGGRGAGDVVP